MCSSSHIQKMRTALNSQIVDEKASILKLLEMNKCHKLFICIQIENKSSLASNSENILDHELALAQIVNHIWMISYLLLKLVCASLFQYEFSWLIIDECLGNSCLQQGMLVSLLNRDCLVDICYLL